VAFAALVPQDLEDAGSSDRRDDEPHLRIA
jgi:hypothetical protein